MPLKTHKPTTPSRRHMILSDFAEITKSRPERALTKSKKRMAGRNSAGRISVRHRGGGHKRRYRIIDFKRDKFGIPAKVASIEYDPNRSVRIALVNYVDGDKRYILLPNGLNVGDVVMSGPEAEDRAGNAKPLSSVSNGTIIHNIEMTPGQGGQIVRSAGGSAQVLAKEEKYTLVRLPSGEVRKFLNTCMATVGQLGNLEHKNIKSGKAGRNRHLGRRPSVRGSEMTPRDHPHGGGEGRSPIGLKNPKTPWGKVALGHRTRKNKRTDVFIVRRRYQK